MKRREILQRTKKLLRSKTTQFVAAFAFGLFAVGYVYFVYTAGTIEATRKIEAANDPQKVAELKKRIAALKKEKKDQALRLKEKESRHRELTAQTINSDAEALRKILAVCNRHRLNVLKFSALKKQQITLRVAGGYTQLLGTMEALGRMRLDVALVSYTVTLGNNVPVADLVLTVKLLKGAL
jgi:hypothetical protein